MSQPNSSHKFKAFVACVAAIVVLSVSGTAWRYFKKGAPPPPATTATTNAPLPTAPPAGLSAQQLTDFQNTTKLYVQSYVQAEIAAIPPPPPPSAPSQQPPYILPSPLTANYLCPLNVAPSSGLCLSLGSNGQLQTPELPYAKMLGNGAAVGFVTPFTLKFGKAYLKGGMTYDP